MDIRFFSGPEAFSDISNFHRQPGSPWRTSANTSNNTCHISIIFRHALPRLSCAPARAVIIIPAACTLLARYYGVILYSKIKAASFRVRARDYDSCNKPISIGRHNSRALPENFNAICTEKRRPPLLHPLLFIHVRERTVRRICKRSRKKWSLHPILPVSLAYSPSCLPTWSSGVLGLGGDRPRARSLETIESLLIYHPVRMQRIPREINYCR